MTKTRVAAKRAKYGGKTVSKRALCKLCGCRSGKKWEECCGRCILPC